jgi:PAS domain S-box-containing protein
VLGIEDTHIGFPACTTVNTMARGGEGSDGRFAAVAESVNDAIIGADDSGTIRYANEAAARLFGRAVDDLLGAPLVALMPERLREQHLRSFARFIATGESTLIGRATLEVMALSADGTEVPVELSLGAWSANGERGVTGVIRDISERKAAERATRAQEAVSRVLAETDDVEVAMKALLRELGRVMGWTVGLFWERSGSGLMLASSWHEGTSGHAFLERSASLVFARGIGLPGKAWHEGRPLWVEDFREVSSFPRAPEASADDLRAAIALPVIDSQHEVIGVIEFLGRGAERPPPDTMATMALLGDRIGQFVRRKATEAELARSNAELTRFADAAARDLSEPVRTMRGLAELLCERHAADLDDDGRELLAGMLAAGARGEALVQAILAYARVGGDEPLEDEPVDTKALVDDIVTVGELPVVRGDRGMLEQLFKSLLANALEISAVREGSGWRFRIADNGAGIAPSALALCRRIVERHGGHIHVEDDEPAGSVFWFTLPSGDHPRT